MIAAHKDAVQTLDEPIRTLDLHSAVNSSRVVTLASIYGLRLRDDHEFRYVGQTRQPIGTRLYQHRWQAGNLVTKQAISGWIRKYGAGAIVADVLEELPLGDISALDAAEVAMISRLRSASHRLLNMTDGGGGMAGYVISDEARAALSARNSGANNPRFGAKWTPELRARIEAAKPPAPRGKESVKFGTRNSAATRALISANHARLSGPDNANFGVKQSGAHLALRRGIYAARSATQKAEISSNLRAGHAGRSTAEKALSSSKLRDAWARQSPEDNAARAAKRDATRARNLAAMTEAEREAWKSTDSARRRASAASRSIESRVAGETKRSATWAARTPEQREASLLKRKATRAQTEANRLFDNEQRN